MRVDVVRAVTAVVLAAGLVVGGTSSAWATGETGATAPAAEVTTADPGPGSTEGAVPTEEAPAETAAPPSSTAPESSPSTGPSSSAPQPDEGTGPVETTAPVETAPTTSPDAPTTTPAPGTTPATDLPSTGGATATASRGCLGETSVVVTVPGLEVGTRVAVRIAGLEPVAAEVLPGGRIVVETVGLLDDATVLAVTVQVEDLAFLASATVADVCTATGTITVSRDCLTPDLVSAAVDVSGLQDRPHGVAVLGVTEAGQEVLLASADVLPVGGRLTGSFPLVSLSGAVPLEAISGFSLLVDGVTFASVAGDLVDLVSCVPTTPVTPEPVAPVPAAPAPAVPVAVAPVTHPVARPAAPSSVRAAPVVTARPATLATTGSEVGSLALLGVLALATGAATTVAARRPVR